ncbi:flagellar hook-basal body protein [Actinomycetes bacterium NPDC127524]
MLRGFYTAASGMIAQQRKTEMLTNNLSNADTPGFKTDQSSLRSFPDMLLERIDRNAVPAENGLSLPVSSTVGNLSTGIYMQEATPLFSQGDTKETQRNTDVALVDGDMPVNAANGKKGSIFFTVENADGQSRYTRNGNFALDGQGYLTTSAGDYVLDDNKKRIKLNSENFTVSDTGYIEENGQPVARLGISFSDNPYQLVKEGDGLFKAPAGTVLNSAYTSPNVNFTMKQGFIESSNVDQSRTMTDMMSAYRSFEANQKILQAYDRSMDKAVNEVGKLG